MLVIVKYLLTEFINHLIKTEVDLCLNLIVEKLPSKVVQGIVSAVAVEVQWVEDVLHHVSLLVLQDVVGEDPREGHLDGKLNPLSHRQLQIEFPEPELGEVTALTQCT